LERWGSVIRIENSSEAIKYLNRKGVKFQKNDINTIKSPLNYYDLICFFDVLYHKNINDDIQILKNAYSLLKPDGILLITDSAIPWLYSHHDAENMARERYTLPEITTKVHAAGFKIVKKSYLYFFVFPLFLLDRLIGKIFSFEDTGKVNPLLNMILYHICKSEAIFFKYLNYPIGSSVFIKAIKK
jgi:SAM-dependent methyltransferase